jgi:hypothetical protein
MILKMNSLKKKLEDLKMADSMGIIIFNVISEGKAFFKSGDYYEGEFKDGRMGGFGKMNYSDIKEERKEAGKNRTSIIYDSLPSAVYEGYWKAGKRHGHGTIVWTDES